MSNKEIHIYNLKLLLAAYIQATLVLVRESFSNQNIAGAPSAGLAIQFSALYTPAPGQTFCT